MIGSAPVCVGCAHFNIEETSEDGIGLTCAAFPNGIPDEILFGDNDHQDPFPGDHGIQYEAKSAETSTE